jgi:ATP-binding cassette subfamily C protein
VPEREASLYLSKVFVRCPITKNRLLRNVDIEIAPGSSAEIVGGGGSGKTVLAETLVGRFARAGGKILLGPVDLERLSIDDASKVIGYVPQRVDFISGTLLENIAGFEPDADPERICHVARLAEMHEKIVSLPDGYLTRIDPLGSIFSKSERHQLALARALYPDPQLLIVDEPDSTFRDALSRGLSNEIDSFLARGGILVMLTRVPLKRYQPTRRFTLDAGDLRELKQYQMSDAVVVRGPEWLKAR